MGVLDKITDVLGGSVLDGVSKLVQLWHVPPEKVLETQAEQAKIAAEMQTKVLDIVQTEMQSQTDVNKVEAASTNMFIAGWRPFIGWVCGSGLAYMFVARPLLSALFIAVKHPAPFPELDMGTMLELLMGMLGLGGMRTYEKLKGVEANR